MYGWLSIDVCGWMDGEGWVDGDGCKNGDGWGWMQIDGDEFVSGDRWADGDCWMAEDRRSSIKGLSINKCYPFMNVCVLITYDWFRLTLVLNNFDSR